MEFREYSTDVLVVGGGTSGVCAAIQAARQGASVVLVNDTPWLGGMLTAAGVSAIDGNHKLPSGLWGEFRAQLYAYYGGPEAVETGWVSNTQFEPHVGAQIFERMVSKEKKIQLVKEFQLNEVLLFRQTVTGAIFSNVANQKLMIHAGMTIDATEYGDVLALAGCEYRLGRDARSTTDEADAPENPDDLIQDLTYVAILKDFGPGTDHTIPKPENYNPAEYFGTCRELHAAPGASVVDCETMLKYGALPNQKFMINWPIHGNDFYANITDLNPAERTRVLVAAKNFTLGWIFFLQTEGGFKNLGLADDEFPTDDRLALMPYIRESRRLKGVFTLTTNELTDPYAGDAFQNGVAVGDYPLDHHHQKAPVPVNETFPSIPAFNVPFGCLIPEKIDGLLVAEKSISVTHLVNGCTRLQPVVMQLGQAAGAAAALCVQQQVQPRALSVRPFQQVLLDANLWLMPFCDISPKERDFQSIQRIGLTGALRGELVSKDWANEMRFHPEKKLTRDEALQALKVVSPKNLTKQIKFQNEEITRNEITRAVWLLLGRPVIPQDKPFFSDISEKHPLFPAAQFGAANNWFPFRDGSQFLPRQKISRREFAWLLDAAFHPFSSGSKY